MAKVPMFAITRFGRVAAEASLLCIRASTSKPAAREPGARVRNFSLWCFREVHQFLKRRSRLQESLRVRMLGAVKDFLGDTFFDDSPQVHHRNAVGEIADGREVMRNVEERTPFLLLDVLKQVQNLGANGKVQSRRGLVANDQGRLEGKRSSDGNTLTLTTGKLMRIAIEEPIVKPNLLENGRSRALLSDNSLRLKRRLANRPLWIQAGVWVLPNHPDFLGKFSRSAFHHQAVELDLSTRERLKSQHGSSEGCLSAARFANDGNGFAFVDDQRNTIQGADHAAADRKLDGHV